MNTYQWREKDWSRIALFLCMLVLVFMWSFGGGSEKLAHANGQDEVIFSDSALENAIRDALNVPSGTAITMEMMEELEELDLSHHNIVDLQGIQHAVNLKTLNLSGNYIRSLTPLPGDSSLEQLDLSGNLIRNITPLNSLTHLRQLNLSNNAISDISTWTIPENMEYVDLSHNQIADIDLFSQTAPSSLEATFNFFGNGMDPSSYAVLSGKGATIVEEDPFQLRVQYDVTGGETFGDDFLLQIHLSAEDPEEELVLYNANRAHFSVRAVGSDGLITDVKFNKRPWSFLPSLDDEVLTTDATGRGYFYIFEHISENNARIARNTLINEGREFHIVMPLPPGEYDLVFETFRSSSYSNFRPISTRKIVPVIVGGSGPMKVQVEDPALETYLRDYLAVGTGEPITTLDMALMTKFHINKLTFQGVENLWGMEHASNLKSFSLANNHELTNLDGLYGAANLKQVSIRDSSVTDVSFLAYLEQLEKLVIERSPVGILPDLSGLVQLRSMTIVDTPLSDLSPLIRSSEWDDPILQNLEYLHLEGRLLSDLSPLAELSRLRTLSTTNTSVSDLAPVARLVNLEQLYLEDSFVKDLTPVAQLANLETLWVEKSLVSDLSPVTQMESLTGLWIMESLVKDLTPLGDLKQLDQLNLSNNIVEDISPLSAFDSIGQLVLEGNLIRDLAHVDFANFPNVRAIWLGYNPIEDYSALEQLPILEQGDEVGIYLYGVEPEAGLVDALAQKGYDVYFGAYDIFEMNIHAGYDEDTSEWVIQSDVVDDPGE